MGLFGGVGSFFGLDIGTTGVRAVQLSGSNLQRFGHAPIDIKTSQSDSKADQQKLAAVTKELLGKTGINTNNVAVGIPSNKVFTTVVDIDRLSSHEMAQTIKYQADSLIPTPIAESKIDWSVIGDSPKEANKVEVLLSSVPNEYIEARLDLLESIGLNVVAFEPDNLALVRSVLAPDSREPQMVLDIGSNSTDLVITMGGSPRLTRSIATGAEALMKAAQQNLNIDDKQAREFVTKFGLNREKLEGQVYDAIVGTVDALMADVEKSIKFFQTRYKDMQLSRIVLTGGASQLPQFPAYLANKTGVSIEIGNPWRNVNASQSIQNELINSASQFGVAVGLAERNE